MSSTRMRILLFVAEVIVMVGVFFAIAGVAPPAVNEAHYLAKSKHYWQPDWCPGDLFLSSGNPHLLFHYTFGALTRVLSLESSAWVARLIGWLMIAVGLRHVTLAMTSRPFASVAVALIWIAGVDGFNLAGEWVIGGIEGKVPAYGLVLIAFGEMVRKRWVTVWPLLGLASGFHVLVGGWTTFIALVMFVIRHRQWHDYRRQILPLGLGAVVAMIGVYPALMLTGNADAQTSTTAAKIYCFERLSHHVAWWGFESDWIYRHVVLIAIATWASWRLRRDEAFGVIRDIFVGSVLLAAVGCCISGFVGVDSGVTAKLLRFYWFRMTDAFTPLAIALAWVRFPLVGARSRVDVVARIVIILVSSGVGVDRFQRDSALTLPTESGRVVSALGMRTTPEDRQRVLSDWVAVCEWIDRTMPANEVLLTPRNQHTFKWYANRAEVVNWKDVPQDAGGLVQWSARFKDVFPARLGTVRTTIRYPDLTRFRTQYGARFMIVDRRYSPGSLPLVSVYPTEPHETNQTYGVYRLP